MDSRKANETEVNITIERTQLFGGKVPSGIKYNFKANISLTPKNAKALKGYVEKIHPSGDLSVELNVQQLNYYYEERFDLDQLINFDQDKFIDDKCNVIKTEIQDHLKSLKESLPIIKKLTKEDTFTSKKTVIF